MTKLTYTFKYTIVKTNVFLIKQGNKDLAQVQTLDAVLGALRFLDIDHKDVQFQEVL